jgi:anthranilate phosphoribosyltransferase
VLSRVAVGPRGSRDLDRAAAREALRLCLDGEASAIQAAVFLIAMRLKRETSAENLGFSTPGRGLPPRHRRLPRPSEPRGPL